MSCETLNPTVSTLYEGAPKSYTPILPTELWLQILENVEDIEHLWTSVRLVSRQQHSYVEQIFQSYQLPRISVSLSLPRHDPSTGALLYRGSIPGAEIVMTFAGLNSEKSHVILKTPVLLRSGVSIKELSKTDVLNQRRLEEAAMWLWFGRDRMRGGAADMRKRAIKKVVWDESENVWECAVEWRQLVGAYVEAKRTKRRSLQSREKVQGGSNRKNR